MESGCVEAVTEVESEMVTTLPRVDISCACAEPMAKATMSDMGKNLKNFMSKKYLWHKDSKKFSVNRKRCRRWVMMSLSPGV